MTLLRRVRSLAMRRRRQSRAVRLILGIVHAIVLSVFLWQGVGIEIADDHDVSADCSDDEPGQPCDCGPNCHCCLACAHRGPLVLPFDDLPGLDVMVLGFLDLPDSEAERAPRILYRGPPPKVPKLAT